MAKVFVGRSLWWTYSTYLEPGQTHGWTWNLANILEAVSITAHPELLGEAEEARLRIEGLQVFRGIRGGRVEFWVRNVGGVPVGQYSMIASFISE